MLFEGLHTQIDVEIRKRIFLVSDDPYYPYGSSIKSLKMFYKSFYDFDEEIYQKYLNLFKLSETDNISNFSKIIRKFFFSNSKCHIYSFLIKGSTFIKILLLQLHIA